MSTTTDINVMNTKNTSYQIADYVAINEELQRLLPELSKQEYDLLKADIRKNGYDTAEGGKIIVWYCDDDMSEEAALDSVPTHILVEGHHRWKACHELYEETGDGKYLLGNDCFDVRYFDDINAVKMYMVNHQLCRRNMAKYAVFEVYYENKDVLRERARQNMSEGGRQGLAKLPTLNDHEKINTRDELAKTVGVSSRTIAKFMKIVESDNEEVKGQLRAGKMSAEAAYKEVTANHKPKETKSEPEKTDRSDRVDLTGNDTQPSAINDIKDSGVGGASPYDASLKITDLEKKLAEADQAIAVKDGLIEDLKRENEVYRQRVEELQSLIEQLKAEKANDAQDVEQVHEKKKRGVKPGTKRGVFNKDGSLRQKPGPKPKTDSSLVVPIIVWDPSLASAENSIVTQ